MTVRVTAAAALMLLGCTGFAPPPAPPMQYRRHAHSDAVSSSALKHDVPVLPSLPVSYDVEALERLLPPGLLVRRAASLGGSVLGLAATLGADYITGRYSSSSSSSSSSSDADTAAAATAALWVRRGPNIRGVFENGGPTFVKFGQALASRSDLLGPGLARELLPLQDRITPFDDGAARAIVERELPAGSPDTEEILTTAFSTRRNGGGPAAAASVSQVYRATIRNGTVAVAVKVQRPPNQGRLLVASDALLLRRAAMAVEGAALAINAAVNALPAPKGAAGAAGGRSGGGGGGASSLAKFEGSLEKLKKFEFKAQAVDAVDEFMSRLFEEMDFENERRNMQLFGDTYGGGGGAYGGVGSSEGHQGLQDDNGGRAALAPRPRSSLPPPGVRVPQCFPELCGPNVIVMEWIDGEKLLQELASSPSSPSSSASSSASREEDLLLVRQGIDCTLSQLLETGIMHADPHGGNLLKVRMPETRDGGSAAPGAAGVAGGRSSKGGKEAGYQLAYLDFGLVSVVPESVRDGIVAGVVLLVDRRYEDVAALFGDLMLLPPRVMEDEDEFRAFAAALRTTAERVLDFDGGNHGNNNEEGGAVVVAGGRSLPALRFDRLLGELLSLAPRFEFQLPPYFLNNARALGTLEGMVAGADPSFSVLQVVYPFALRRLLANPSDSQRLRDTLDTLVHADAADAVNDEDDTKKVEERRWWGRRRGGSSRTIRWRALRLLLDDAARLLGVRRRRLVRDVLSSPPGRRFALSLVREQIGLWLRLRR